MSHHAKRAHWEARYGAAPVWTGRVNEPLRAWSEAHPPLAGQRALDLACGEGGDALWLVSQGWKVTGVDFAVPAIARATAAATAQGLDIEFVAEDVTRWVPTGEFDLVSLSFFHEAVETRLAAWTVAASAVSEGGTLLVTGHAIDPRVGAPGPPHDSRFGREELVEHFGEGWSMIHREIQREGSGHHSGHMMTDLAVELTRVGPRVA